MNHIRAEKVLQQLLRSRRGMLDVIMRQGLAGPRTLAIAAKTYRDEIAALEHAIECIKTVQAQDVANGIDEP